MKLLPYTYAVLLGLLTCAAVISQEQTPPGEDKTPRPGQPLRCNNFFTNKNKCQCNRAKECPKPREDGKGMEDQDPTSNCQVWCRRSKCGCLHPCTSGFHKPMPENRGE